LGDKWLRPYHNPFGNTLTLILKAPIDGQAIIQLVDIDGRLVDAKTMNIVNGTIYFIDFMNAPRLQKGAYFARYTDGKNKQTIKLIKQ